MKNKKEDLILAEIKKLNKTVKKLVNDFEYKKVKIKEVEAEESEHAEGKPYSSRYFSRKTLPSRYGLGWRDYSLDKKNNL